MSEQERNQLSEVRDVPIESGDYAATMRLVRGHFHAVESLLRVVRPPYGKARLHEMVTEVAGEGEGLCDEILGDS